MGYGSLYTKCPLLFKLFGGSVTCSRFETGFRTPNPWWGVDGGTETYRIDLGTQDLYLWSICDRKNRTRSIIMKLLAGRAAIDFSNMARARVSCHRSDAGGADLYACVPGQVGVPRVGLRGLQWLQGDPPSDGNGFEEDVHAMAISMPCLARHWIHCEYIVNTLCSICTDMFYIVPVTVVMCRDIALGNLRRRPSQNRSPRSSLSRRHRRSSHLQM